MGIGKSTGILLVLWKNEDIRERCNCSGDEETTRYDCSGAGDLDGAFVFRCPLKRAMKIIVSQDSLEGTKQDTIR